MYQTSALIKAASALVMSAQGQLCNSQFFLRLTWKKVGACNSCPRPGIPVLCVEILELFTFSPPEDRTQNTTCFWGERRGDIFMEMAIFYAWRLHVEGD